MNTTNGYRVVPIPDEVAHQVRASLVSPQYGHPAHVEIAGGYGPCRSCLETFRVGEEERILLTFNAFDRLEEYPEPGPIFVHRESCRPFTEPGFPPGLRSLPLTLEAFSRGRWLVAREHLRGADPEPAIARLLAVEEVDYVHIRNTEAGCYIARIERGG